jgi:hypothetical protein
MPEWKTVLRVNGEVIPLNEFVSRLLSNLLLAIVWSLKGTPEPRVIELRAEEETHS